MALKSYSGCFMDYEPYWRLLETRGDSLGKRFRDDAELQHVLNLVLDGCKNQKGMTH